MAADRSPAFNPPINSLPSDNDPMIIKVKMDRMDWANRKSQQPSDGMAAEDLTVQHVPNGR